MFERISGNAYRMRREVQDWLDINVGRGNCSFLDYGCYEGRQWYAHLLYQGFVISFRNHDKAMLFRLTWS